LSYYRQCDTASVVFPAVASDAEVDASKLDASPLGDRGDLLANGRVVSGAMVSVVRWTPEDAPGGRSCSCRM
jgi:hypothetical protein